MNILSLNWGHFTLVCCTIIFTRVFFIKVFPWELLSSINAVTLGFIVFLAVPILGYFELLNITVGQYSTLVCTAFLSFLIGAGIAKLVFRRRNYVLDTPIIIKGLYQFSMFYCLAWVCYLLLIFYLDGGFSRAIDILFGGWAHIDYVSSVNEIISNSSKGENLSLVLKTIANNIFYCLWIVIFIKKPRFASALWLFFIVSSFGEYLSRSTLLGKALIPLFAYLYFYRPKFKRAVIITCVASIAALVFFSWNSAVRLGNVYKISTDVVISDAIRDAGRSGVFASIILSSNLRGNPFDYMANLTTFIIPRSIWPTKPLINFNYDMTFVLTGLKIGRNTSIVTSTMLGEAWYFFGIGGTFWLMLMFGFCTLFFEWLFSKHLLGLGLLFQIIYLSFIQIRSTFYTFFQFGAIGLLSFLVLWYFSNVTQKRSNIEGRNA